VLERNSVLGGLLKNGGHDGADGRRRVRVGEVRGWKLVQVAAFPSTSMELEQAVRPLLGADLPPRVGQAITVGTRLLLKIGPEQFWIITRDGEDITRTLQLAVRSEIGSVTSLSHSRTCIWIDGPSAREVLAAGIAIDLHPDVFEPHFFALTGLHHTPITIYRSGESRYELYVMRTFAVWAWEWLIDAALSFGYEIIASS
jgi:heterotetrameric sarcosine oxidase gamma subunit